MPAAIRMQSRLRAARAAPAPRRGGAPSLRAPPCRATAEPEREDTASKAMSEAQAREILGIREGFSDLVGAKNRRMLAATTEETPRIEQAYDKLVMMDLAARLKGDNVNERARYADQGSGGGPAESAAAALEKLSDGPGAALGVAFAAPSLETDRSKVEAAVFLALALAGSVAGSAGQVPAFEAAVGLTVATFSLRDSKELELPKSVGLACAGLVAGALLGGGAGALASAGSDGPLSLEGAGAGVGAIVGTWAVMACVAGSVSSVNLRRERGWR